MSNATDPPDPDPDAEADTSETDPTFADLLDDRAVLPALREEHYKPLAAALREDGHDVRTKDLLALTPANDTAYITPANIELGKWFAEIYEAEGMPETHPRGMHYRILGEGYERRNGDPYENDKKCWGDMKDGAFWAQVLGFVPADRIHDEKNPPPQGPHIRVDERTGTVRPRTATGDEPLTLAPEDANALDHADPPDSGYQGPRRPSGGSSPRLSADADQLIERTAQTLAKQVFARIRGYSESFRQDYYIEVWAEKSGLIPDRLSDGYGVTRRPAGGGEFSYDMCRNAVEVAAAREQDLVVVLITDFDPKGADMPKSAARKIEVEAALADPPVEAHVHHAAVTKEQAVEYALPTTPAKDPAGLDAGSAAAKGYESHKAVFAAYAGQEPAEVNAFEARYPEEYYAAVEECVAPYYDEELAERLMGARREIRDELTDRFSAALTENGVADAHATLVAAIETYEERVDGAAPEGFAERLTDYRETATDAREDLDLDAKAEDLDTALAVDCEPVLAALAEEFDPPDAKAKGRTDGVLDTARALVEQIEAYNEFDVRYES